MKHRARGFTLIELVVTIAIVGILASAAVPLGQLSNQRAKEQELRSALRLIREALDNYKQETVAGRVERRADGSGYPRSLDDLIRGADDVKTPGQAKIIFLRRLPRDPFNPELGLSAADSWGKRAYASPADAPAEGEDVYDVFSRSERIGLNGIAYREW